MNVYENALNQMHEIIAQKLSVKMSEGRKFHTLDLALEILDEFAEKELIYNALLGYMNKIVHELLKEEYGIIVGE